MAVTLADVAKQSKDPLRQAIIENLLRYSDLLAIVPFENVDALTSVAVRWQNLPTVGFRKFNAGYTESTGQTEQIEESIKFLGGDVDVDKAFTLVKNVIQDPATTQTNMKLKALAYAFNYYAIKGSPAVDADGFYGLEYRVDTLPARQKFAIGTAGTPFDVTASTANEHAFLDGLHKLSKVVGGADAFLMNEAMWLGVASVLRRLGLLDVTKDQFDREFSTFGGGKLIDVGVKADQATEIITDSEDPGDGGTDTTSIYAVKFGLDDGLVGIQINDMDAYWVGGEDHELESKPVKRLRIDWGVGLAGFGSYYAARMYNLKPAGSWT
jgi:hypothetical protein